MEDNRENLVVIVAGYADEMRRFIDSNPGLHSRFTRYIYFEDYNGEKLAQIFLDRARGNELPFAPGAQDELLRVCQEIYQKRGKNFGNARDIRTLFDYACDSMRARMMNSGAPVHQRRHSKGGEDVSQPWSRTRFVASQVTK